MDPIYPIHFEASTIVEILCNSVLIYVLICCIHLFIEQMDIDQDPWIKTSQRAPPIKAVRIKNK